MSCRSGYGRSKIVGKIIHLPANLNMAGLAPRIGKSGASIRLYYQRVDECCKCEPIKIIKRIFVSGDSITDDNLAAGDGLRPDSNPNASKSQAFYAIVYNRKIGWTGAVVPSPAVPLVLNNVSNSTGANVIVPIAVIPPTDWLEIPDSQLWGPQGTAVNINLGNPTTSGRIYGTPTAQWVPVNQTTGIFTRLFGFGGGNQDMASIITNPAHLGGYAIMFNITQILNASYKSLNNGGGSPVSGITVLNSNANFFREDLAIMTVGGNNISTTYTPGPAQPNQGADGNLKTLEGCFGEDFEAPIGGFTIADGTGLPKLENYLTN
jgi:hypothetical protein